jgi:hypothetical protein
MIQRMALTPGGGRSPSGNSTQPPPAPPSTGPRRSPPAHRPGAAPRFALLRSVVRWGVLVGGLVIIVDLGTKAMIQGSYNPEDMEAIAWVDQIFNWVLFSILGIAIVRETGLIYSGALAGALAAVLDAILVAVVNMVTPPVPTWAATQELFLQNVEFGTLFAAISGVLYFMFRRWSGGRRLK